ncbi:MAG: CHASE domain-containing protein [Melioribacteraceae bacterium]|nr:CHASE domain-containing protein [Melioribacteraceae bacterium]
MSYLKNNQNNNQDDKAQILQPSDFKGKRFILPIMVLVVCWIITYFIWNISNIRANNDLRLYFEFRAREVNILIQQRLDSYKQILRDVRGLFVASDNVDRTEFSAFYNSLQLEEFYPGIQGIGFSLIIPSDQKKEHIDSMHKEGFPEYRLLPDGIRETYTSIIYLEPFNDRNLRAYGFDMFSEPIRRKAMEVARDSNEVAISGKVILVQEIGKEVQAGFLLYLPVYKNGVSNITLIERRKNILGWVYSPFRMRNFIEGLFGEDAADLDVEIYDGKIVSAETKMFDSQSSSTEFNPPLKTSRIMNLNENEWAIVVKSTPKFMSRIDNTSTRVIIIVGISISILLAIITWLIEKRKMFDKIVDAERIRHAIMIENTNKELTRINTVKDKFFSIIAHDLKSPFQGFLSISDQMADESIEFSRVEFFEYSKLLNISARAYYKLLENLLEWAQVQKGSINYMPKDLDLTRIVSECIASIRSGAIYKGIAITNELQEKIRVNADEKMIGTVIRNLLSNAVKFTNHGGKINISSRETDNNMVVVSVSDNGMGMPFELINKLFKMEEKVGSIGTDGEPSTGLGLLLCKEFVEIHGGEIWVESAVNEGSTFSFTVSKENKQQT